MKIISGYKFRIILWYTGLLALIVTVLFYLLNTILIHDLKLDIEKEVLDKAEIINRRFAELDKPSEHEKQFFSQALPHRRVDFSDIRELVDYPDDKFLLAVMRGDELVYLTKRFRKYGSALKGSCFTSSSPETVFLEDIPFFMMWIDKGGYGIYLGYRISYIYKIQDKYRRIFYMVFPLGILLSILCGYFVTQRSLAVINRITDTARRITTKNLGERIKEPRGSDEIKDLIRTLNSMIDRLEKDFNTIQQFSEDAAHEIRTPLTIIRGELEEILAGEECPEVIAVSLDNVLEEIQYLATISNKLLLIHSMNRGSIEYDFHKLDLKEIIQEVFEDAKILSSANNYKVAVKMELCQEVSINGNRELVVCLLWNLIDNGIKYNRAGGQVVMNLSEMADQAVIHIKDTGIGIAESERQEIFKRFYRVDKSRSRKLGGSGLGLAICKWIIELHNGRIEVSSHLGTGSEFTVFLPVV